MASLEGVRGAVQAGMLRPVLIGPQCGPMTLALYRLADLSRPGLYRVAD